MTLTEMRALIQATINQNGAQSITGQDHQDLLMALVEALAASGQGQYNGLLTYEPGATTVYDGLIWKATQQATGNWDQTRWTPLTSFRVVHTLQDRDAVLSRFEGLRVLVLASLATYTLSGGITNADWQTPPAALDAAVPAVQEETTAGTKNLGVGTETPSEKLHVNGNVRLEGQDQWFYWGPADQDGTYRMGVDSGTSVLTIERRESGAWVPKQGFA